VSTSLELVESERADAEGIVKCILLIGENATPRNSEYFLMKLGTVIRCSLKIK
jgi:hypothetical protein